MLRRGPDQVQVGLDPRHALVLPASAAVRRTLEVLTHQGPVSSADPDVVRQLEDHGALAPTGSPPPGLVDLRTFGVTPLDGVHDLLDAAGLHPVDPVRDVADLGLLVGVGEPDRALLDAWVAESLPHLVLRITEGVAVVGPFVDPGRSACLRCIDGHRTDADPRWPLLVEQQATAVRRGDGVPDPAPPALVGLASAWAVADLLSHLRGERPATWSATLRLPASLGEAELVTWRRHAECGCACNEPLTPHHPQVGSVAHHG